MARIAAKNAPPVWTPARKRVLAAVGAAVLVHAILLVAVSLMVRVLPDPKKYVVKPEKPLTVRIERPEESESAPEPKKELETLLTNPEQKADAPPPKADFQSNEDTIAASELPGEEGKEPMPSQDGREMPFFHFKTQQYNEGEKPQAASAPAEAQPLVPTTLPLTSPPRPQPNLVATPPPTVGPKELAMLAPQPTPVLTQPTDREFLLRPPQPSSRPLDPSLPSPDRKALPGYVPPTEKTKMTGGLSNRGDSSINAVATPLARYQASVRDAIGARWHFLHRLKEEMVVVGTVRVHFYVTREGKIEQLRMLSNSSNEWVANFSLQSVMEARIPPIPPDLVPMLAGGKLDLDFSFSIY